MAKRNRDAQRKRHRSLALTSPELTILSDQPLAIGQTYLDSFGLSYRLGPVFDIIRHPNTQTPMQVAIYGEWGTGKTTAIKWLQDLLNTWNKEGKIENKITTKSVWFYPWKYETKQDVWRGLVAEVILAAIDVKNADTKTISEAFKILTLFVGKAAQDIISSAKLKLPGFELGGDCIQRITKDLDEAAHPEKPYLNKFENALKQWVERTLKTRNQRMIVFIDDLDRCVPEICFQVLEALKLYLNIPNLIFVMGLDRTVIEKLVGNRYMDIGLNGSDYLSKMFQVEVTLTLSERQIEGFLNQQLQRIAYWQERLSVDEQAIFRDVIFNKAERNPREIKRLISSALMAGSGTLTLSHDHKRGGKFTFSQALQLFFIHRILSKDYQPLAPLFGTKRLDSFFSQWSQIICENDANSRTIRVPLEYSEHLSADKALDKKSLSFAHHAYHDLLGNPTFIDFFLLLADKELGSLMRIPYPVETAPIVWVIGELSKDEITVRKNIAHELGKEPHNLADEDYLNVTKLYLFDQELSELEPVKDLSNIQDLDFRNTQVTNLEPIRHLTSLRTLLFSNTPISSIEPIKNLKSLRLLRFAYTQVTDFQPLASLTNMLELDLEGTECKDLKILKELKQLQVLRLYGTRVENLEPLQALTSLQKLDFGSTPVIGLEPLSKLMNLEWLYLYKTDITDVEPLCELTNLQELGLENTQVLDLEPLKGLITLQELYLGNTKITDLEPLEGLSNLQVLSLKQTHIRKLDPISGLMSLQTLDLADTPVSNLEPLVGLTNLQTLYVDGTQVSNLDSIKKLNNLDKLYIGKTLVPNEQIASLRKARPNLKIYT